MHISKLEIRNFRNFRSAEFRFNEGVNTLIGENGSGKTNVFHAIRLLLDDSLSRKATLLHESDFNRANGIWQGHWIIISCTFSNLDLSEGCQTLKHATGHMTGENTGTYTYFFRPKRELRKLIFETSQSNPSDLPSLLETIQFDQYEVVFTGRATANFSDESVYSAIAGDFNTKTFPDPDIDNSLVLGTRVLQPMHTEVSCTFVKALRDVVADLRNYRDSPLLSLLRGSGKKISLEDSGSIINAIDKLNSDISSLSEIRQLSTGIQNSLHDTVGHSYAPSIDIQSSLPSDIERLLQSLSLRVSDPLDEEYKGDLSEISLGGANLIYLSLKLLEYELKASSDKVSHFLLIEEPESHIHTHIQKTLFEKYDRRQTQVIVSTHSTHISAASKIRSMNILAKANQHAVVFHPSNLMEEEDCVRIERYLDAVRSTLLFAKGVVLVEGDAELILLPALIKAVLGVSIDELGLSLISMSSAIFSSVAILFHEDRVQRRCAIITDSDIAYIPLPGDSTTDSDLEKKARASKIAGNERMLQINKMCLGNKWLQPFYALHTFEVDFLAAENAAYAIKVLDSIYRQELYIAKAKAALQSEDIAIYGSEIMRLAEKEGKGWFALHLAEVVDAGTNIPDYILNALAFACAHSLDSRTLYRILCHRLRHYEQEAVAIGELVQCFSVQPFSINKQSTRTYIDKLALIKSTDPLVKIFKRLH